jgi:streptomycin 6-kinase
LRIPANLEWWRNVDGGAEWLQSLPAIVGTCAELWSLQVGEPFEDGNVALAVPVERATGEPAVLKVNFPEPESEHEGDALAFWKGRGAVQLLESERSQRALLVERCQPGDQLWAVADDEEAIRIAATVLSRLWRPAPDDAQFRTLAGEAERWAVDLERDWRALDRPFERRVLDEAVSACLELGPDQGATVLLHQDFHGANVLRAEREPWLAIDPKPLLGEREFDGASLLRDRRWLLREPGMKTVMRRRLDLLAAELELDRERMRRWGIAHALAWGVSEHEVEADMVECAGILADIGT